MVDEYSMVSSTQLYQIDRKLQVVDLLKMFNFLKSLCTPPPPPQGLKQRFGTPFGGVSLIVMGDPMQLKPVNNFYFQLDL